MKRREVLSAAGAALAGALGPISEAHSTASSRSFGGRGNRTFLFVHGAWHSSVHWGRVVELLVAQGHRALAIDLPGCGIKAEYPRSYFAKDRSAFLTEESGVKKIGLKDYVDAVVPVLAALSEGRSKVVVVGHSFGGQTITKLADCAPHLIQQLVYVTAFCPALQSSGSANAYVALPENSRSRIGPVIVGDPDVTGAYRIDPRSTDGSYLDQTRQAFYSDVAIEEFLRFAAYLNPDAPVKAAADDGRGTVERWGSVPRAYVRCTLDQALPIELQDRMIREADQVTPHNKFVVQSLESGHSPFASMPDRLAALLANL